MGLFENIRIVSAKLGLTQKLAQALGYVSLALALSGVGWLLVLPIEGQFRNTYISENALMPAQANTYFRESEWNIVRGYRQGVSELENISEEERINTVVGWFEDIGLTTARHEWELGANNELKANGTNAYSILHAPRGDHTEAMVLAAPWINKDGQFNQGGVALVIALARYFKKWSLWSKNIIFVISSDSHFALRSWVSAYHTSLENTAGQIEGAVVLDYPDDSDYVDAIEIFYEGLNGQQPNLDLVNSAVLISGHEYLKSYIQDMNVPTMKYKERAMVLGRGILSQLLSGIRPGPGSENFSGWRIDAITLRARGVYGPMDITTFGRVAESLFRSINNLLEHFHQSFFFYFLLTPKTFVSIGTYLPAAMLVANSFSVMAIYIGMKTPRDSFRTMVLIPTFVLTLSHGLSLSLIGYQLLTISLSKLTFSLYFLGLLMVILPIGTKVLTQQNPPSAILINYLHAISLIFHGLVLSTLSTVNFSLGLILGLITIPLAWLKPGFHISNVILLALSCPFTGLILIAYYLNIDLTTLVESLIWSWRGLDLWTGVVIVGVWIPIWITGVIISFATVSYEENMEKVNMEKKKI